MNIISIDFDIIMGPSINSYNEFTDTENEISNIVQGLPTLNGDLSLYKKLTQYLINVFKQLDKDQILFIDDHSQILSEINEPVSLINIDHHHDTGYEEETVLIWKSYIDCGNWARWLFEQKLLEKYTWIKNDNSELDEDNAQYIDEIFNVNNFDFNTLELPDKLIICLSKPWVPPRYRLLFYSWQDLYKQIYKTKDVPFIIGPFIKE